MSPATADGPIMAHMGDLELGTTGHLVTLTLVTGHKLGPLSSRASSQPSLAISDPHTWAQFIGLGFSCDNQGLAAGCAACLYLSMAVS